MNSIVIGSRGGIGSALQKKLGCDGVTSQDLDLYYPTNIQFYDFKQYDTVYNAAGHSKGTYLGFQQNTHENILSQINVNFVSNILLLKRFAEQKENGTYVWISSDVMDHPRPFHSVYASSKVASQYAMDLIKKEITHINIVEIKLGFTKTNFRYNNFLGTKTREEVDQSYNGETPLDPVFVAEQIIDTVSKGELYRNIK